MQANKSIRAIISGGGTGGHIFPAISIANELRKRNSNSEILFVGALGRMEMERVPAEGYKIIGLPVSGIQRRLTFRNIKVLMDAFRSLRLANRILKEFRPDIAIGVGGYASGPLLRSAARMGIPTLLQEQNSYAGVTNKLLAKKANVICVAYSGMERYFPAEKIIITGNPVRNISINENLRKKALELYGFSNSKPVLVIIGGSLGARTINQSVLKNLNFFASSGIQVLWQTGKYYYEDIKNQVQKEKYPDLRILDFISGMDLAYNMADLLVSRAGAISISEICLTGRASILVPSPNVAEDHQTKNAMALVKEGAAVMVRDEEAEKVLPVKIAELLGNRDRMKEIMKNSLKLAKPHSTSMIVDEAYKILSTKI